MKWANALSAVIDRVRGDPEIAAVLGGPHVYRAGEFRELRVPSIAYTIIVASLEETTEPVRTQWDVFARNIDQLLTIERRLRRLLHWVGWKSVGGVMLSSTYEDSRDHPSPDAPVLHRSLDFVHTPVRNRGW